MIHETAHASHWNMDSWHYNHCDDVVAESWARGVQWELTRMIYTGYQPSYSDPYTGVVQDMIDGIGDSVSIKFSDNRCIGYSKSVPDNIFNVKKYDNYSEDLIAQSSFSLIYSITVDAYNSSAVCGK